MTFEPKIPKITPNAAVEAKEKATKAMTFEPKITKITPNDAEKADEVNNSSPASPAAKTQAASGLVPMAPLKAKVHEM